MAFVEIPEEPYKQFLKASKVFQKIGDTFDAVYLDDYPANEERFGQSYLFKIDGHEAVEMSLKGSLHGQLQKAKREGQLKRGSRCAMQLAKFIPTKHDNPAKSFKLKVDPDYKGAAPKNGANVSFDAPPPREEEAQPEEDAPF